MRQGWRDAGDDDVWVGKVVSRVLEADLGFVRDGEAVIEVAGAGSREGRWARRGLATAPSASKGLNVTPHCSVVLGRW